MDFYDSSYDNPYHTNRHSLASDYLKNYQNRNTPNSRRNFNNNNQLKRSQSNNPYFPNNNNQFNPIDAARLESLQTNLSPLQMYPRNNFNHNIHSRPDLLSDTPPNYNRNKSSNPYRRNNYYDDYLPRTLNEQMKKFEALDEYINAPSIISNNKTRANSENDETFNFPKKRNNQPSLNYYNNYPYEMLDNNIPTRRPILSEQNYQPYNRPYIPKNNSMLNPDEILPKIVPTSPPIDTGYLYPEPSHKPVSNNNNNPYFTNNNKYNNYTEPTREPADDTDSSFWEIPKEKKEFVIQINYPRNPVQPQPQKKEKKPKNKKHKKPKKEPLIVNYTEPKQEEEESSEQEEPETIVIPRKIKKPESQRKKPKVYHLKTKTPSVSSEEEEEIPKKKPEELFQFEKQNNQVFYGIPKAKKEKKKRPKKKKKQEDMKKNQQIRKVQREHTILTNVIPKEKEGEEEEESEESNKEKEFLLEGEIPGDEDYEPKLNLRKNKKEPTKKEDLSYKEPLNTIPVYPDKESSNSEPKNVPIKRVKSKLPTRKEDLTYMDALNVEPKYSDKSSHSSKPIKKVKSKATVKDEDLNYLDKLNVEPEYPENETPEQPIKRISKKQPTRKEDLEYKEPLNTIPVYPDKESSNSEPKNVPIKRVKSKLPTRKEDLTYMDALNVEPKYSDKSSHSSKPIKKVKSKATVKDEDLNYLDKLNVEPEYPENETPEQPIKRISKKQPTRKEDLEYFDPLNIPPIYSKPISKKSSLSISSRQNDISDYLDDSKGFPKHIITTTVLPTTLKNKRRSNSEISKNSQNEQSISYHEPIYSSGLPLLLSNKRSSVSSIHSKISYYEPISKFRENEEVKSDSHLSGIISGKEDSYKKKAPSSVSILSNSEIGSKLEPIEEEEIGEYIDQSLGQRKHIVTCSVNNKKKIIIIS